MTNHKKAFGVLGLLSLCAMVLSLEPTTADAAAVPEPGTVCGAPVERWRCAYATPSSKPAGWYTPSKAIPAGKDIYNGCSSVCIPIPIIGGCNYVPTFTERPPHANDIVLNGARRAWCGTSASHATEYWTIP